jgi:hypothetical protein
VVFLSIDRAWALRVQPTSIQASQMPLCPPNRPSDAWMPCGQPKTCAVNRDIHAFRVLFLINSTCLDCHAFGIRLFRFQSALTVRAIWFYLCETASSFRLGSRVPKWALPRNLGTASAVVAGLLNFPQIVERARKCSDRLKIVSGGNPKFASGLKAQPLRFAGRPPLPKHIGVSTAFHALGGPIPLCL